MSENNVYGMFFLANIVKHAHTAMLIIDISKIKWCNGILPHNVLLSNMSSQLVIQRPHK